MEVVRVVPLDEISGKVRIETATLIFLPNAELAKEEHFKLSLAKELFKRVYKLLDNGIEVTIISEDGETKILYIVFA